MAYVTICFILLNLILKWIIPGGGDGLDVVPMVQRYVAENLVLHENMVIDHLHTSYSKLLART